MFIKKSKRIDQIFVPVAEIPPNPRKKTHQRVAMTRWWSVEAAKVWLVVGGGGWWSRGGGGAGRAHGSCGNHQQVVVTRWWRWWSRGGGWLLRGGGWWSVFERWRRIF